MDQIDAPAWRTKRVDAPSWCIELMHRVDAPSWRTELMQRIDAASWRTERVDAISRRTTLVDAPSWRTELTVLRITYLDFGDASNAVVKGHTWTQVYTPCDTSIHTMWSTCFANRVLLSTFDIFFCSTSTGSNDCKSHVWYEYGHWYMKWIYAQNGLIDLPSPLGLRMTTIRQL